MNAPLLLTAGILVVIVLHDLWRGWRRNRANRFISLARGAVAALRVDPAGGGAASSQAKATFARRIQVASAAQGRTAASIATIITATVIMLLSPTLAAPPYAGPPVLTVEPSVAEPGSRVAVSGAGFDGHLEGVLALDGDTAGMPGFRVRGNGTFEERFGLPANLAPGLHMISALAPGEVATMELTVASAPSPPPNPSTAPTATPQQTASVTATPDATPASTPDPTLAATPDPTPPETPVAAPTPTPAPPSSGNVDHVFVVVMENRAYSEVWNTASTPYTTSLANTHARADTYYAITHPSLPNYLDLFAGSDYGIATNCNPSASCHIDARNLADNLEAAGLSWKGYFESMETPCKLTDGGGYIAHHNPFIYFDDIRLNATRCTSHVVNYAALTADLASTATSPNYALIVPNNCNNTHDCSIATGDAWLAAQLPLILDSPACIVERCLLVLTWDEDDGSLGNHVLTVFAGSAVRTGSVSTTRYDHFSLLRTVEAVFGLPNQTANDAAASPMLDMLR